VKTFLQAALTPEAIQAGMSFANKLEYWKRTGKWPESKKPATHNPQPSSSSSPNPEPAHAR
jgi:hypothetical protein